MWQSGVRQVRVWVSWSGLARQGVVRLSLEWYGFPDAVVLGVARFDLARYGKVWVSRFGRVRLVAAR